MQVSSWNFKSYRNDIKVTSEATWDFTSFVSMRLCNESTLSYEFGKFNGAFTILK